MKRLLLILFVCLAVYSCDKEKDAVYDASLFQQLQDHSWIMDSVRTSDSLGIDSFRYATDTTVEITQFNSQQYLVNTIRISDSAVLDTITEQIIYDNPRRMYYYDQVTQEVIKNQYLNIDTVNAVALILTKMDTLKATTRTFYHAK